MDIIGLVILALVVVALVAAAVAQHARSRVIKEAPGHQHIFIPRTVRIGDLSLTVEECACGERRLG